MLPISETPPIYNWGCKGTTKNAHLQTKLRKVYFQCNFVSKWAALCDRTFGGEERPEWTFDSERLS
jgi:hypothetical protein